MTQFASTLYPQTNPTNIILLELRESLSYASSRRHRQLIADEYLALVSDDDPSWPEIHKDHARRVLTRLANFSG